VLELKVDKRVHERRLIKPSYISDKYSPEKQAELLALNKEAEAKNAVQESLHAEKVNRLVHFCQRHGFETQVCYCDLCRFDPDKTGHVQMVYKINKVPGTILLLSDVRIEYGPDTREGNTDKNRIFEDGVCAYRA